MENFHSQEEEETITQTYFSRIFKHLGSHKGQRYSYDVLPS